MTTLTPSGLPKKTSAVIKGLLCLRHGLCTLFLPAFRLLPAATCSLCWFLLSVVLSRAPIALSEPLTDDATTRVCVRSTSNHLLCLPNIVLLGWWSKSRAQGRQALCCMRCMRTLAFYARDAHTGVVCAVSTRSCYMRCMRTLVLYALYSHARAVCFVCAWSSPRTRLFPLGARFAVRQGNCRALPFSCRASPLLDPRKLERRMDGWMDPRTKLATPLLDRGGAAACVRIYITGNTGATLCPEMQGPFGYVMLPERFLLLLTKCRDNCTLPRFCE